MDNSVPIAKNEDDQAFAAATQNAAPTDANQSNGVQPVDPSAADVKPEQTPGADSKEQQAAMKTSGAKDGGAGSQFSSSDRQRDGPNVDNNQSFDEGRQSQDRLHKKNNKSQRRKKRGGDSDGDRSRSKSGAGRNRDQSNKSRGSFDSDRNNKGANYGGFENAENAEEMNEREHRRRNKDRERRDDRSPGRNDRGYDDRYGAGDEYYGGEGAGYHRERRDRGSRKERSSRTKIEFPSFMKPMYTRKDFEMYQQQKFDKQSLYEAYNEYSIEYKQSQEQTFYRNHRNDPWFIEKYDPCEIFKQRINLKQLSQYQSKQFQDIVTSLKNEESPYRQINLEQDPNVDYNLMQDEEGKDLNLQKAPLFSFDTDFLTLYLKYIPKHIKRNDLTNCLQKNMNGFVHLSMSEPMRNHDFERLAWASFSNESDCQQAEHQINNLEIEDFSLQAVRSLPNRKKTPVRITPPLPQNLIELDLELCKLLITEVFDPEKDIDSIIVDQIDKLGGIAVLIRKKPDKPGNDQELEANEEIGEDKTDEQPTENDQPLVKNDAEDNSPTQKIDEEEKQDEEPLTGPKLTSQQMLDILLIYLRRVHAYDLYCGEEYEDERMLSTKCGPQHLRNHQKINEADFQDIFKKSAVKEAVPQEGEQEMETEEVDPAQELKASEILGRIIQANDFEKKKKELIQFFQRIANLNPMQSANYGGSITFLTKYVKQAVDRLQQGPQKDLNPEDEFYQNDLEDYCRSQAKEIKGKSITGFQCTLCHKKFKTIESFVAHIKNKHQDKIDETYKKSSTKDWFEKTFKKEMKQSMKNNYYNDPNKLLNQPGRKYYPSETSYYTGNRDWINEASGGPSGSTREQGGMSRNQKNQRGNYGGSRQGRGGYKNHRDFVDYDDPVENAKNAKKKDDDREMVDYSDLFG